MKIILLKHLAFQAEERGINIELVKSALSNPDQTVLNGKGLKVAHRKYLDNGQEYLLRVIFKEEKETRIGITVYRTSKIDKYWRSK